MSTVPLFLGGVPVVAYTRIDERHRPTGSCRHFAHGALAGPAAGLAICRDSDGGFFLFGCDAEWNPVTDTWHETLEDAQHQAEFEYEGITGTWMWP
ncbi:MAG TPA: hypothetical protein VF006_24830 [Longimicrobium sp.]